MSRTAPKKHNAPAPNMEVLRMMWVEAVLKSKSYVNRRMLMDTFKCSATCASTTLSVYSASINPDGVRVDPGSKAIEAREDFQTVLSTELSPDTICQFINVMRECAKSVRAAA